MLKNVPKVLSPELLKVLCEMGHGDEIVVADGNFPSASVNNLVLRADGIGGAEMLDAVLTVFPLDTYATENAVLMEVVKGDNVKTPIWDEYKAILSRHEAGAFKLKNIDRFDFYDRAKKAYAVIATGEGALYANIILKKGVIK
jgi:L-fucose mutarotase